MNERYTQSDFEKLLEAEFRYGEQMKNIEEERSHLYTTEHNKEILDEIEKEIIAERKKVFVALGLEEAEEMDKI